MIASAFSAHALDPADWMRELLPYIIDKNLNDIAWPGSHDSATHKIDKSSNIAKGQDIPTCLDHIKFITGDIIANWSKAQKFSIYSQLMMGVRFLDLRITHNDSEKTHYSVHGVFGQKVDEIIEEIWQFMDEHPTEIIILSIGGLSHMIYEEKDTNEDLIQKFYARFGDKYISNRFSPNTPLIDILNTDGRLILIYQEDKFIEENVQNVPSDFLWSKTNIVSPWAKTDDVNALWKFLEEESKWFHETPKNQFYLVGATLTPNEKTIISALNPFDSKAPKNISDMAKIVREKINFYALIDMFRTGVHSIFTMDFVNQVDVEQIIWLNALP